MTDVQRAGRIGRNEFDHDGSPARAVARPKLSRCSRIRATTALPRGGREKEVDESGARDLGARRSRRRAEHGDERRRELARIALERLRQLQRDVGRVVAVLRLLGPLERRAAAVSGRNARETGGQPFSELGLEVGQGIRRRQRRSKSGGL